MGFALRPTQDRQSKPPISPQAEAEKAPEKASWSSLAGSGFWAHEGSPHAYSLGRGVENGSFWPIFSILAFNHFPP